MATIKLKHKENGNVIIARNELQARAIKKQGFEEVQEKEGKKK